MLAEGKSRARSFDRRMNLLALASRLKHEW
jgi:hypothetical protein